MCVCIYIYSFAEARIKLFAFSRCQSRLSCKGVLQQLSLLQQGTPLLSQETVGATIFLDSRFRWNNLLGWGRLDGIGGSFFGCHDCWDREPGPTTILRIHFMGELRTKWRLLIPMIARKDTIIVHLLWLVGHLWLAHIATWKWVMCDWVSLSHWTFWN